MHVWRNSGKVLLVNCRLLSNNLLEIETFIFTDKKKVVWNWRKIIFAIGDDTDDKYWHFNFLLINDLQLELQLRALRRVRTLVHLHHHLQNWWRKIWMSMSYFPLFLPELFNLLLGKDFLRSQAETQSVMFHLIYHSRNCTL